MFSVRALMVPTAALAPAPDQEETNWLLRVTFLSLSAPLLPSVSLSLFLAVSRRSTFGHPEAQQCHFMPSNGCESLIHREANLQFPATARVRQPVICMHRMFWVVPNLGYKTRLSLGCVYRN